MNGGQATSRYIDAEALRIGKANPNVFNNPEYANGWNSAIDIILNTPTADVQAIRHAYWKRQSGKDPEAVCSACGREAVYQIIDNKWAFENFCPHCGAKMEGESKNA